MYLTAHRVRTDDGTEGVNAFIHRQSRQTDPTQVADVLARIEQDAGILVAALCDVPPGRNHVLAYLDVVLADGAGVTERELQTARASFQPLVEDAGQSVPMLKVGPIAVRFGCTIGIRREGQSRVAYDQLWEKALALYRDPRPPTWVGTEPLTIIVTHEDAADGMRECYQLDRASVQRLRRWHGPKWLPRRFSVELSTKDDYTREHGDIIPVAINALTDIPEAEVIAMGGAVLRYEPSQRIRTWPESVPAAVGQETDDQLCQRLTGYPSVASLFDDVFPDYVPSIYLRGPDETRLANAYDAEAQRRGDPRRAMRFKVPTGNG